VSIRGFRRRIRSEAEPVLIDGTCGSYPVETAAVCFLWAWRCSFMLEDK
jgi:hypothetical protein